MNYVLISVEGQTEETFVRNLLQPYLWNHNVNVSSVILSTSRTKQGNKFKGGLTSLAQATTEIQRLLHNKNVTAISTMYDYYGLPNDFPGSDSVPSGRGVVKAQYLEQAFEQHIGDQRFRAYFQVHEFEALLFANPTHTAKYISNTRALEELTQIRQSFSSPEDINNNPATAPSKRILQISPEYEKPLYGTLAALDIGLDAMRRECLHFNEWVTWLESLG